MDCAKLSTTKIFVVVACLVLLLANISQSSQEDPKREKLFRLLRTDFETYSSYQNDPIAQVNIPCQSASWSVLADWGDGTPSEVLSHAVLADEHAPTSPGMYSLYSAHRYTQHGKYDASFKLLGECSGKQGKIADQDSYPIEVFEHVPLETFVSESSIVRRGAPVVLTLKLAALAPKSGTRIVFQTSGTAGIFPPEAVPSIVSIPSGTNRLSLRIPTLKTAPVGTVTLTVISINGPHSLQIRIE
jgi:hypothetical protein